MDVVADGGQLAGRGRAAGEVRVQEERHAPAGRSPAPGRLRALPTTVRVLVRIGAPAAPERLIRGLAMEPERVVEQ
ncbi:hypothetical protein HFP71_09225 [Streptomyces sp. ARC32]